MDVLSLLRLLVRHWRVTVPAALLTLLGVVAVVKVSAPTYRSTGSIVLLSPPEPPDVSAGGPQPTADNQNPYVRFGDLSIMADILARIAADDMTRAELMAQGVTKYEVSANRFSRGPVIEATGEERTQRAAIRSADNVLTEVQTVLADLQEAQGIDPEYFITTASVQPPSTASAVYGSTMRMAIGALVVGGLSLLALAVLAEVVVQRRAGRRIAPAPDGAVPDVADEGVEAAQSNGSTAGGSGASEAGGHGVEAAGSNGSFNSAGIVPGGAHPDAGAGRGNGLPIRGRVVAPSDGRVYRRSSPPDASTRSPADDDRDQPTSDR
jgi:hypothetical protein